jgi:hypothetical protein
MHMLHESELCCSIASAVTQLYQSQKPCITLTAMWVVQFRTRLLLYGQGRDRVQLS